MFGKVIQFRSPVSTVGEGGTLPDDISSQFSTEVLDKGLALSHLSRISHINFGRESYFGLVPDPASPRGVSVHIALHPETKLLTRATCSCFRSNTRTYCHHIVSFVRYILRPDEETGGLRSLGEDFQESFWNDIGWFGYKHFGDSTLGFHAQVNHGGEGLRISFSDRSAGEVLAFMPGERLVDEYLFEFFDLIRRDIDSTMFKRMYGRKLKHPNVPSLRRRPWSHSASEEDLNRRGLKSALQHHEDSYWHRIAKIGFILSGRQGGSIHFSFLEHKHELFVEGLDEQENVILRLVPPRPHIGTVIDLADKRGVIGSDLFIHPKPLKTGYRIDLAESSALVITPVVENPDPDADPDDAYIDRTLFEKQLFGSYYFFPDWGFFKITVNTGGLPVEYFSAQKKTVVPPEKISAFLDEYGELLRQEPGVFADEGLFRRKTVDRYEKVIVEHKDAPGDSVALDLRYSFGDFSLSFRELFQARRTHTRFLVRGHTWIDTQSSEFDWMDALDESVMDEEGTLTIGRTEYLRFIALHDRLERHFSSTRIKEWFHNLEALKPPSVIPSIAAMKGKLRRYQKNGLGWLWFLYENGFSGLLCDDMGLGKTHQVMALMTGILQHLNHKASDVRFLVVCPTTVLSHWKDKVLEYCPHLEPYVYHGTDRSFREAFDQHRLIITSYGIALRDVEVLSEYRFELLVLDEIQAVKNKSTKTYAAVKALDAVATIGLTGTPIENTLADLKALFDVILPGYLMTDSLFDRHFRRPIEEGDSKETETRLVRVIHPFTLRRTKDQVLKELPPKIEDVRRCALSPEQLRFYRDVAENQGKELVQQLKDPSRKVPYMHVFAVLNYLKQICNHPALLEGEAADYHSYESGKWDLFVELLEESLGSGQKVAVFSQYVKMLALIESYLNHSGIAFATIKGSTRNRGDQVRRFNTDPSCMVFSASLRASGLGIDLTAASVVIHYDRWWNSAREEQATDRVHRIGQRRGVQVFKLVTEGTLEEKIDAIISRKRRLMDAVVREDDKSILKHFSREDLIELISF